MNKKEADITAASLEVVNKQVIEMKKKTQLLEGQRRAHYEMWDNEKKKNTEKIKLLKDNVKKLYSQLAEQTMMVHNRKMKNFHESWNKCDESTLQSLDFKIIETRKKLDLLQHEINQRQQRLTELSAAHSSKPKNTTSRWILPSSDSVSSLENRIHQIEIKMMEADHIRKKYKTIRNELIDEKVGFESTLRKLEEKIGSQENEIARLQVAYEEAIRLRNETCEILSQQETKSNEMQKTRESELDELKSKVDAYKVEIEKLERRMRPAKLSRQSSASTITEAEDIEISQRSEYLEKVFEKLKEVTGVVDTEDVLKRFLSQRETRDVLEKMKTISETEKETLLRKKEEINSEFEAYKFADVRDNERNDELMQTLKDEIEKQTEKNELIRLENEKVRNRIVSIMQRVHGFCLTMKHLDVAEVPEKCPSIEKNEWLMRLFQTKVQSALRQGYIQTESEKSKIKNTDLWSQLPFANDSKMSDVDEDDEDDEIPTRRALKEEAQQIYATRNRRKGYRPHTGKHF